MICDTRLRSSIATASATTVLTAAALTRMTRSTSGSRNERQLRHTPEMRSMSSVGFASMRKRPESSFRKSRTSLTVPSMRSRASNMSRSTTASTPLLEYGVAGTAGTSGRRTDCFTDADSVRESANGCSVRLFRAHDASDGLAATARSITASMEPEVAAPLDSRLALDADMRSLRGDTTLKAAVPDMLAQLSLCASAAVFFSTGTSTVVAGTMHDTLDLRMCSGFRSSWHT
jgi:hypothetical protein